MTGVVILILRIILVAALYSFLFWALFTIWQDLKARAQAIAELKVPILTLTYFTAQDEHSIEFEIPDVVVGRDTSCGFQVDEDTVSARHARFSFHHGQWWVEDLKSTNGTYLNEEGIFSPVVVISGDEIHCGQAAFSISIRQKPG